ncbi:hypothetical protein CLOM_g12337 [Closterium sp. NIES-68]|nr:hypothetical protein CLOM_g12337 [Closterium sp. NIES-68]
MCEANAPRQWRAARRAEEKRPAPIEGPRGRASLPSVLGTLSIGRVAGPTKAAGTERTPGGSNAPRHSVMKPTHA